MSAYRIAAEKFIDPIPGIWKIICENWGGIILPPRERQLDLYLYLVYGQS